MCSLPFGSSSFFSSNQQTQEKPVEFLVIWFSAPSVAAYTLEDRSLLVILSCSVVFPALLFVFSSSGFVKKRDRFPGAVSGGQEGKREEEDAVFEAAMEEPGAAAADALTSGASDVQVMSSDPGARAPDGMAAEGGAVARNNDEPNDASFYLHVFELYETQSVRKLTKESVFFPPFFQSFLVLDSWSLPRCLVSPIARYLKIQFCVSFGFFDGARSNCDIFLDMSEAISILDFFDCIQIQAKSTVM